MQVSVNPLSTAFKSAAENNVLLEGIIVTYSVGTKRPQPIKDTLLTASYVWQFILRESAFRGLYGNPIYDVSFSGYIVYIGESPGPDLTSERLPLFAP